jgi:hypothetical protein
MRAASGILRAEVDFAYLVEHPYFDSCSTPEITVEEEFNKSQEAEGNISNDVVNVDFRVKIGHR